MKYFRILFVILVIGLLNTNVIAKEELRQGPELTIKNSTNETYVIMLYWIDHPFLKETFGRPFNTVGAEMAPGESFSAIYRMGIGEFCIRVYKLRSGHVQIEKHFKAGPKDRKLAINICKGAKGPLIFIARNGTYRL